MEIMTINGKPLSDFNTFFDTSQTFIMPERDVEFVEVAGRNGSLMLDNNRYKNVDIPFNCFIREDYIYNYNALMNYISAQKGYVRIETTTEPDVYRLGKLVQSVTPRTGSFLKYGHFTLTFNCKPQKYLKEGEKVMVLHDGDLIVNNEYQDSKPLLALYGAGKLIFYYNGVATPAILRVTDAQMSHIYVDCETENAYMGATNVNPYVVLDNDVFPHFIQGETEISISGFSLVECFPRWWRL